MPKCIATLVTTGEAVLGGSGVATVEEKEEEEEEGAAGGKEEAELELTLKMVFFNCPPPLWASVEYQNKKYQRAAAVP